MVSSMYVPWGLRASGYGVLRSEGKVERLRPGRVLVQQVAEVHRGRKLVGDGQQHVRPVGVTGFRLWGFEIGREGRTTAPGPGSCAAGSRGPSRAQARW